MADIINLRQARKRKSREENERMASEKRAIHGRSRVERRLHEAKKSLESKRLDEAVRSEAPAKNAD